MNTCGINSCVSDATLKNRAFFCQGLPIVPAPDKNNVTFSRGGDFHWKFTMEPLCRTLENRKQNLPARIKLSCEALRLRCALSFHWKIPMEMCCAGGGKRGRNLQARKKLTCCAQSTSIRSFEICQTWQYI